MLHGCKLVTVLLAVGAPPQKVLVADERHNFSSPSLPPSLAVLPGQVLVLRPPFWAATPLRCVSAWVGQGHARLTRISAICLQTQKGAASRDLPPPRNCNVHYTLPLKGNGGHWQHCTPAR